MQTQTVRQVLIEFSCAAALAICVGLATGITFLVALNN